MTHQTPEQLRARFLKQFNALAQHRRRYEVFRDFVTPSAISLNNVMEPDAERKATLEAEYMGIIRTYRNDDALGFAKLEIPLTDYVAKLVPPASHIRCPVVGA